MPVDLVTTLITKFRKVPPTPGKLLCIDPGGTTGIAIFESGILQSVDQVDTIETSTDIVNYSAMKDLLDSQHWDQIVTEDYRIYQHKLTEHSFSKVPTLRLIGYIESYCYFNGIPLTFQMASQAKGFCTDDKLKKWGLWQTGKRHSRDAIRHGIYWYFFHK